jgi:glutathione gamma-glutamylcysteinyltransferase
MLECCSPLEIVKERGITLDQFVCLAKCHGLNPQPRRFDQTTFDQFKEDLHKTSTEPGCHMVVSFSREALGQTGIGHFSPIGAYHSGRGLALVLDVARFKYPSYWAPIDKLWASMEAADPDTGTPRGYIMLRQAVPRITGCP